MEDKVALLTRETFCQALRMIREQDAINEEVAAALGKVSGGVDTFGCDNKWFEALLMVLKEAVNDQYDSVGGFTRQLTITWYGKTMMTAENGA